MKLPDEQVEAAAEGILDRMGLHEHTEKQWLHAVELARAALEALSEGGELAEIRHFTTDDDHYIKPGRYLVIPLDSKCDGSANCASRDHIIGCYRSKRPLDSKE